MKNMGTTANNKYIGRRGNHVVRSLFSLTKFDGKYVVLLTPVVVWMVYVLEPTVGVAFGTLVAAALAHGCPVVASDCPTGQGEVTNSAKVGLLAEVGNANDLADRLEQALEQRCDPIDLRTRAADFSLALLNERIRRLFEQVAKAI